MNVLPSLSFEELCAAKSPTPLHAKYPVQYNSWKDRKYYCKTHEGWTWAPEWNTWQGFMKSMGPPNAPGDTLDRKDPFIKAYGPGLCKWSTKIEQANNKGNNIKIVEPGTGKVWTPKQIAKATKVLPKTAYKRIADADWHPMEVVIGKKAPHLHDWFVYLDKLPAPPPAKKAQPIPIPQWSYDLSEWRPIEDDLDYYRETGIQRSTHYDACRAEYDAIVEWVKRKNAGLPVAPEPPVGKYCNLTPDFLKRHLSAQSVAAPKPKAVLDDDEDDDFDDCAAPPECDDNY